MPSISTTAGAESGRSSNRTASPGESTTDREIPAIGAEGVTTTAWVAGDTSGPPAA